MPSFYTTRFRDHFEVTSPAADDRPLRAAGVEIDSCERAAGS
jgi:hypothetical protein